MFDEQNSLLYVSLRQIFSLWFIPLYKAPVRLVSVLQLTQCNTDETITQTDTFEYLPPEQRRRVSKTRPKYFIASQEDLYPVNDCLQLLLPGLGPLLLFMWQLYCAWLCVMGSMILPPLYIILKQKPKGRVKRPKKI